MQNIVPWWYPIGVSRRAHNHVHQSTRFHVIFVNGTVWCTKTSDWRYNFFEVSKPMKNGHAFVTQYLIVSVKSLWCSLKMMLEIQMRVPWSCGLWRVCGSWWADRASKKFSECHLNIVHIFLKIARWPVPKQATGVIIVSKYRSLVANDTYRSVGIHRFVLNAREAAWRVESNRTCLPEGSSFRVEPAWRWDSMSASWHPPAWNKHPNHLCVAAQVQNIHCSLKKKRQLHKHPQTAAPG